jgi:hypothetical protein
MQHAEDAPNHARMPRARHGMQHLNTFTGGASDTGDSYTVTKLTSALAYPLRTL